MAWDDNGDIVVVLPGIIGSVLERDGKDVFGLSVGAGMRALFSGGESIRDLALVDDRPRSDDRVTTRRLAPDAHLVPGLWKIDGYSKIVSSLGQKLTLQSGVDLVEFPYDWRLDNRIAARRLREESARWLHTRRQAHPQARLILLAHSMGGLVARYFIEVLGGWRDTRRLVTFGTPHRGSLDALDYLVNGYQKLFGLVDLSMLMRSFTSVYQLLPIYPCVAVGDGPLVRPSDLVEPIGHLDLARVAAADAFHREIEQAVQRNLDDAGYREQGYGLNAVVGAEHPTKQAARWADGKLTIERTWHGKDMDGDGTVPRVSATPLEQSEKGGEWFSGTRHASLQNARGVLLQVRRTLTTPGLGLASFRAMVGDPVSIDLEDVYPAGEPITVRVRPASSATDLRVAVADVASSTEPWSTHVPFVTDWQSVELPPQQPGCYRVTVSAGGDTPVDPASDLVLVG